MQLPIFIEITESLSVNANHVLMVSGSGPASCVLTLAVPGRTSVNGNWSAGGQGSMSSYTDAQAITAPFSRREWDRKVNDALALINMMTQGAPQT